MVIKLIEGYTWFPKPLPSEFKVEIISLDGTVTNVTDDTLICECSMVATDSIGEFVINIDNNAGDYNNKWIGGEIINCYVDYNDATNLVFKGILKSIKGINIDDGDNDLEIKGTHISGVLLGGKPITKSYIDTEISVILKDIITTYTTGFTTTNVNTTTTTTSIGWEDAPFWKVVIDLCNEAQFELYVDNNYDFHFFARNSIENTQEAIIEEDTLLSQEGLTDVTYDVINRVKIEGKESDGIKILYVLDESDGGEIKQVTIKDESIDTMAKAIARANAEIKPAIVEGVAKCYGLPQLNAGELVYVDITSYDIVALYRVAKIIHRFGHEVDFMYESDVYLDNQPKSFQHVLSDGVIKTIETASKTNSNDMEYSYSYPFDDISEASTLTNMTISNGSLKITSGTTGTFISTSTTAYATHSYMEVRASTNSDVIIGTSAIIGASFDNGVSYVNVSSIGLNGAIGGKIDIPEGNRGTKIKLKIILTSTTTYPKPEINGISVLCS